MQKLKKKMQENTKKALLDDEQKKADNIKRIIIKINIKTICELIKKYVRNIVAKEQKMPSEFLKNNIKNRAECPE